MQLDTNHVLAAYARVYLDGKILGFCTFADDDAGEVRIAGSPFIPVHGEVRIEFPNLPPALESVLEQLR